MRHAAILLAVVILFAFVPNASRSQTPISNAKKGTVAYEAVMTGEMTDDVGTKLGFATVGESRVHLGFTTFKGPNGIRVTLESGEFTSSIEALRYLNHEILAAPKVVKQGDIVNESSEITGRRAEITDPRAERSTVIWTNGAWFYGVLSTSLDDCLKFEAQYRR